MEPEIKLAFDFSPDPLTLAPKNVLPYDGFTPRIEDDGYDPYASIKAGAIRELLHIAFTGMILIGQLRHRIKATKKRQCG